MIELIAVVASLFASFVLALFVLLKNPRSANYLLFFGLTISLIAFSSINYISVYPVLLDQLMWIRLDAVAGAIVFFLTYVSLDNYPRDTLRNDKKFYKIALILTVILSILSLTPLIFNHLEVTMDKSQPVPGPAIPLLVIHHIGLIIITAFISVRKYRNSNVIQKSQLRLLLMGLVTVLASIIIFNFIFVQALKNSSFVFVSSFAILAFTASFAYSIVKHGFLEIRIIVARSVTYILVLATLGLIYGALLFGAGNLVAGVGQINIGLQAFYILIAILLALTLNPLRRFFDRVTNTLFYRDAYDPQQLLDQLNKILVIQVGLESLLEQVAGIMENTLKAEYCAFVIRQTSYFPERLVGNRRNRLNTEDIRTLQKLIASVNSKIIITDALGAEHNELKELLKSNNISVVSKLLTTGDLTLEGVGYLLFGNKKSGNLYTDSDLKVITIIANELVIAIQNALRFEEIEKFNATLQEKVDDATKQLRRTNDKLKAMDETKDEFISMASHQLRTPLTSVKGYLSMVLEGDAGEVGEMQRKLLDQAFVSSQRMVYLIADLLNVSRLRTGKFVIEAVPSSLADVVESEVGQLKETAAGRGLTLTYEKPANFPQLYLDETKIRQVIMNFTDNAIYYTPNGGHIAVKLEDKDESIEFTVTDDGMGVPKSEQPHLFTKFYRAGNARKARPDGTGLGLFMAKKVIVAQGGNLIFNSQEGKGSTFGFAFPKAKLQIPPIPQPAENTAKNG